MAQTSIMGRGLMPKAARSISRVALLILRGRASTTVTPTAAMAAVWPPVARPMAATVGLLKEAARGLAAALRPLITRRLKIQLPPAVTQVTVTTALSQPLKPMAERFIA